MADGAPSFLLPRPFALERFFARWEFAAPHLLCCSDCEPLSLSELLAAADADSRARFDSLRLAYTESAGLPALREAIAGLYDRATPEQVLVCVPEEGIYLVMRALLRPGDRVVSMCPAYQSLTELAQSTGCSLALWEPRPAPDSGALVFDVRDALALIQPGVKLFVANFPHNPTGAMLSAADWQTLLSACEAAGCYLLSDEMYRLTEPDEAVRLPSAAGLYSRAISLGGLSKSWGLPGLRCGWLVLQDAQLRETLLAYKDYTTICAPAPSEVLALAAVRATPQLTQRCRDIIAANTALADAFFTRWVDVFDWAPPAAGPVVFPRLRAPEQAGGIDAWCERLVTEAGVLLLPASKYEHEPSTRSGRFRLGLGRRDFATCLKHLDAWLVKQHGEPAV